MNNTNDNVEKVCNFYMSDWHFTVMILPYINKEINQNVQIITFFEKDISQKFKTLVGKLNLKNEEEILKINWNNVDINKSISEIENKIKNNNKNLLIINGTNDYIKNVNYKIKKEIKQNTLTEHRLKIIDCYDFNSNKEKIDSILKKYDSMLNTSGEIKISNIIA